MYFYFLKKRLVTYLKFLVGVVAILALSFYLFSYSKPETYFFPSSTPKVVESIQEPKEQIKELPVRLIIPSIDVDAEVQYVGLAVNGTGEMAVPSNFTDVAWYKDGVRPGMQGSAVIAGHYNGKKVPEAVFYNLSTLDIGDEVIIMNEEQVKDTFYVVKVETYEYDAPTEEVFVSTDGKARLNLITCGGEWLPGEKKYNKRTVVFTELESTNDE